MANYFYKAFLKTQFDLMQKFLNHHLTKILLSFQLFEYFHSLIVLDVYDIILFNNQSLTQKFEQSHLLSISSIINLKSFIILSFLMQSSINFVILLCEMSISSFFIFISSFCLSVSILCFCTLLI